MGFCAEHKQDQAKRTCVDLIDNLLRRVFVEIVHYDVRAARTVQQRVAVGETLFDRRCSTNREKTDALPRPPPAPVTTTTCPLKDRVICEGRGSNWSRTRESVNAVGIRDLFLEKGGYGRLHVISGSNSRAIPRVQ